MMHCNTLKFTDFFMTILFEIIGGHFRIHFMQKNIHTYIHVWLQIKLVPKDANYPFNGKLDHFSLYL